MPQMLIRTADGWCVINIIKTEILIYSDFFCLTQNYQYSKFNVSICKYLLLFFFCTNMS